MRLWMGTGRDSHAKEVQKVQEQVRAWQLEGRGRRMCTGRPQFMTITQQKIGYKDKMYRIYVDLGDILDVDTDNLLVTVEPSVSIGMLNRALVEKGYTLPIVPELDDLTIGGLVMGGGIESTSHKYGLFRHICMEYELVTADGNVVIANSKVNPDIYQAIPMSYGTLGFLTKATIKIIPYKPYIRLDYKPARSLEETINIFTDETNKSSGNDSVEGIMFGQHEAVIMTGNFVSEEQVEREKINRLGRWYKPWFFLHVMTTLTSGPRTEYIPTLDFHQRHNKPCFWLAHVWLPYGHTFIFRVLFGWLLPISNQLLKFLRQNVLERNDSLATDTFVLQDFLVPLTRLKATLEFSWSTLAINPIWLVPARLDHTDGIPHEEGEQIYIDVGLYGYCVKEDYSHYNTMRNCEKFVINNRGFQALYAEVLMTKEEYLEMFSGLMGTYDAVRERLPRCKEGFPEVYDKISKVGREGKDKMKSDQEKSQHLHHD